MGWVWALGTLARPVLKPKQPTGLTQQAQAAMKIITPTALKDACARP